MDETGLVPSYIPGCNLTDPNFKKNISGLSLSTPTASVAEPTTTVRTAQTLPYACADFRARLRLAASGQAFCANLRGNLGRNVLIGPGMSKLDFSVIKNNHIKRISENFNVQFRAEFFNIINRANFSSPTDNLAVFDQTGQPNLKARVLTSTQTTPARFNLLSK